MSGGGFSGGGLRGIMNQLQQTNMPQNMQPQVKQGQQQGGGMSAGGSPGFYQPGGMGRGPMMQPQPGRGAYGRSSWPGQGHGGMPGGRYGGGGGFQGGGYGGMYGGGGYGQGGFARGNMYGPGSYGGYPGAMGYGGGQGMQQMQNPWGGVGGNQMAQMLSGLPQGGYQQQMYKAPKPWKAPVRVAPPWTPKKQTRSERENQRGSDGPGGDAGNASSGGGNGGGGGGGGGDGSGCFALGTLFEMADGSFKQVENLEIGDKMRGGTVTRKRSGPSTNDWYSYAGTDVTDEHFVFEDGVWKYVMDAHDAFLIPSHDVYYTVDTTGHRLYGVNDVEFTDDAVFDDDHPLHKLPYEKATWDLMLVELNERDSRKIA